MKRFLGGGGLNTFFFGQTSLMGENFVLEKSSFFFGQNFFYLPNFIWLTSFGETTFGELHLVKLHWRNFILRRLVTPILSMASRGSTLAAPVALIFSNGPTNTQTNKHLLNYIIDH